MSNFNEVIQRQRAFTNALYAEESKAQRRLPTKEACEICPATNINLFGIQTIQGYAGAPDARVLLINQTDKTKNGIWLMQTEAWVRAYDANTSAMIEGCTTLVKRGDYADSIFLQSADDVILGTTELIWVKIGQTGPQGEQGIQGERGLQGVQGNPGSDAPVFSALTKQTVSFSLTALTIFAPCSGTLTATLPLTTSGTPVHGYTIYTDGTGVVTLQPSGADLIDDSATLVLAAGTPRSVTLRVIENGKWGTV